MQGRPHHYFVHSPPPPQPIPPSTQTYALPIPISFFPFIPRLCLSSKNIKQFVDRVHVRSFSNRSGWLFIPTFLRSHIRHCELFWSIRKYGWWNLLPRWFASKQSCSRLKNKIQIHKRQRGMLEFLCGLLELASFHLLYLENIMKTFSFSILRMGSKCK